MRTEKDLKSYQREAIKYSLDRDGSYLALYMGLGKTVCALTVAHTWMDTCTCHGILYVAPMNVCLTVVEAETKLWKHLKNLKVVFVHGPDKLDILNSQADIYVINPEGIKWLHSVLHRRLRHVHPVFPFNGLIVDEGTKFKTAGVQWRKLKGMYPIFNKRIVMSGRPAPNSLLELWTQMFLLDRGKRLGRTLTSYRRKYFDQDYTGYRYLPKHKAEKRIYKKIRDIMFTVDKSHGNLPMITTKEVNCKFTKQLAKEYAEFKKEKIIEIKRLRRKHKLKAKNAMSLSMKLRQYCQGLVYSSEGVAVKVHQIKYEALNMIIESANGTPVMIVYNFNHERDFLKKKLGGAPHIGGGVDRDKQVKTIHKWNRGKISKLLVHPKSTSHGLNMQGGGNLLVFYSPTWSGDEYHQLISRLCRTGQKSSYVIVYHISILNTIDPIIYKSIENKNKTHEGLTRAILKYLK
jgi:SNF2 family DNA or RNA helicase